MKVLEMPVPPWQSACCLDNDLCHAEGISSEQK